jgi:predicted Zn-dependent peptidase
MYFNAKFSDDDFRRECEVIEQEIIMHDDNPRHALGDLCMETYFAGTKYGHPIAGSVKSVKSFKPQMVYDFIQKHYVAEKTILAFAGDITAEQIERVVKKYWVNRYKDYRAKPVLAAFAKEGYVPSATISRRKKKISQHNVGILFPACTVNSDDRYTLRAVREIFSGDMSSRLFVSVREKLGLVYSIRGGMDLFDMGGFYYINFSCVPKNTQKVIDTISAEIDRIKAEGVTDDEVQKFKNKRRSDRLFGAEDVENTNQRNATQLWDLGAIETVEQYLKRIDKITALDVKKAAEKYLDMERAQLCVVGNPQFFHKLCKKVVKSG